MDVKEFYPSQYGAFESPFYEESRATGPDGDEENTGYEASDAPPGGLPECNMPSYKAIVLAKKSELKDQYGKGHFVTKDCGMRPLAPETILNMICAWDCGKDKNKDKWCCKFNAEQAIKREVRRKDIQDWMNCSAGANAIGWVSGWRAKWNEFKRNDGLAQLKAQSKCESSGGTPLYPPTTTPPPMPNYAAQTIKSMSCQEMKDKFGITPGVSWGTAANDKELLKLVSSEWTQRQCFVSPALTVEGLSATTQDALAETNTGLINKIVNNKGIAAIIGTIIVVVLITAVILIPTKKVA